MHVPSHFGSGAADCRVELVCVRSETFDGFDVQAQCFAVTEGTLSRHEIILDSGPHRAVVDVPRGCEPEPILARAMEIFAHSMLARG